MAQLSETTTLRARNREAAKEQVIDAALGLFVQHGYEAVTVEQIATSVGLSRRSLHRYFSSKDDIILCKYDSLGDTFVELLQARPMDEDGWESLRHVFTTLSSSAASEELARRDREMTTIINASPSLFAGFLERSQRAQAQLADALRERERQRGEEVDPGDPRFEAVVAAACACRTVALTMSASTGMDFQQSLSVAMGALTPTA